MGLSTTLVSALVVGRRHVHGVGLDGDHFLGKASSADDIYGGNIAQSVHKGGYKHVLFCEVREFYVKLGKLAIIMYFDNEPIFLIWRL